MAAGFKEMHSDWQSVEGVGEVIIVICFPIKKV